MNRLFNLLDSILEQTVFLSFSRIGYSLRKHFWHEKELAAEMSGKVCIVTGANSGLGFETSKQLATMGARIYMLVRDPERGLQALDRVQAGVDQADVHLRVVDLSRMQDVRDFVDQFIREESRLDVLVNNAGVLIDQRILTEDGLEMTLATNVVGPFLLTHLLIPIMEQSVDARIIHVSSGGMYTQKLDLDGLLETRGPFNGVTAYAQTKRAQVILTELWAQRMSEGRISIHAMHPGWVDTPGLWTSLPKFSRLMKPLLRIPSQGVDTILWLAVAPNLNEFSGSFWHDRALRRTHKTSRTVASSAERQALWEFCESFSEGYQGGGRFEAYHERGNEHQ